jgi:hypothetical protein
VLSVWHQPNIRTKTMQKIETFTYSLGLMLSGLLMIATVTPIA